MKKKIFCICLVSINSICFAQTGVNTKVPRGNLELLSKPFDLDVIDGLLPPKIRGEQLKSKELLYTNNMEGTIIYVNEPVLIPSGLTIDVTEKGFYLFRDSKWKFILDNNIYNSSRQIKSNRNVNLNNYNITFNSNEGLINQFSIGDKIFSNDIQSKRNGIGLLNPTSKLHVLGESTTSHAVKVVGMKESTSTDVISKKIVPVGIDENGNLIRLFSPIKLYGANSYSFDGKYDIPAQESFNFVTGINDSSIVIFEFNTNFTVGNGNTSLVYGKISYSKKRGFQVDKYTSSGGALSDPPVLDGVGTDVLTIMFPLNPTISSNLEFSYNNGDISVKKLKGTSILAFSVYNGRKF